MLPLLGVVAGLVFVFGVPMFIAALTRTLVHSPISAINRANSKGNSDNGSGGLAVLGNLVFLFFVLIAPFIDGKGDGWSETFLGRFQSFIKVNVLNCWPSYYEATRGFGGQKNDLSYIILNWFSFVISGAIVAVGIALSLVLLTAIIGSFSSKKKYT